MAGYPEQTTEKLRFTQYLPSSNKAIWGYLSCAKRLLLLLVPQTIAVADVARAGAYGEDPGPPWGRVAKGIIGVFMGREKEGVAFSQNFKMDVKKG